MSVVMTATKAPVLIPIRPPCEFSRDDSIGDYQSNLRRAGGSPIVRVSFLVAVVLSSSAE